MASLLSPALNWSGQRNPCVTEKPDAYDAIALWSEHPLALANAAVADRRYSLEHLNLPAD